LKSRRGFLYEVKRSRTLILMAFPAVVVVLLFGYIPISGIILAFKDFRYNLGIFRSPWAGFENFRFFFISGTGFLVTRNTILYNLLNLATSQVLAITLAILISEMQGVYFKKIAQSITFLPYFISWIIVGVFVYNIFNYEKGTLNTLLKSFHAAPINMYSKPVAWVFIIMFFNSWKWVGYASLVYIASIMSINMECFESADIDGANIFQKIRHITIPSITPTITIIVLLNIGRLLRGDFQMFYQIIGDNGQLFNATDVIDTFVFRSLIHSGDLTMASAANFYQSVLCFVIIITVNTVVRKVRPDYALF
jgi:putative aldouronate transport system permease protein